jgi:sec-independent protein translocase protein TatB
MFDIGFAELLLIGVVALVVLGPERLPVAARTAGLWLGRIKRTVSNIQSEITEELRTEELKRNVAIRKEELDRELDEMRTPFVPTSAPPAESSPKPESDVDPEPAKRPSATDKE